MKGFRVPGVLAVVFAAGCHHAHGTATGGPMAAAAPTPSLPAPITAQLIAQGDSIYNSPTAQGPMSCARCHGPRGDGGQNGPSLTTGPWLHGGRDHANLVRIITNGMPRDSINASRQFAMNPRGGRAANLTDPQISALAAYVWSISAAKTQ